MKSMPPRNKSNAIDKWLKNEIESGSHIGLEWIDDKKQTFRIPWMHASRRQWDVENDASLYKSWAKFKKRYKKGTEVAVHRCSTKKMFLRISLNL